MENPLSPVYASIKWTIVHLISILSFAQVALGQNDCQLKKQKDDLKVYTCSTPDSKLKILKAEMTVENVTVKEFVEFLRNIHNCVKWQYNTIEAAVLEQRDGKIIYRTVIEAPWPVSNREMILELSSAFDSVKQELTVVSRSIEYGFPESEDLVRVPFAFGKWKVVSIKTSLKVEYFLQIDPGGSVPIWLLNMAMAEGPYSSLMNLKDELRRKPH
jgi:hypothetical protein